MRLDDGGPEPRAGPKPPWVGGGYTSFTPSTPGFTGYTGSDRVVPPDSGAPAAFCSPISVPACLRSDIASLIGRRSAQSPRAHAGMLLCVATQYAPADRGSIKHDAAQRTYDCEPTLTDSQVILQLHQSNSAESHGRGCQEKVPPAHRTRAGSRVLPYRVLAAPGGNPATSDVIQLTPIPLDCAVGKRNGEISANCREI